MPTIDVRVCFHKFFQQDLPRPGIGIIDDIFYDNTTLVFYLFDLFRFEVLQVIEVYLGNILMGNISG